MKQTKLILALFLSVIVSLNAQNADADAGREKLKKLKPHVQEQFRFSKHELKQLEKELIEEYLDENFADTLFLCRTKIFNQDGSIAYDGYLANPGELRLKGCAFLFEHNSVSYYLSNGK